MYYNTALRCDGLFRGKSPHNSKTKTKKGKADLENGSNMSLMRNSFISNSLQILTQ